mgnify:CR=1 FL=1
MNRFAGVRVYPFLMAAYPALAMMAANVDQVEMTVVLRPLLLGQDPQLIERHWAAMYQQVLLAGRRAAR